MTDFVAERPELKQIIGALLFAAKHPLSADQVRRVLVQVAEREGGAAKEYAEATPSQIRRAVDELRSTLKKTRPGFHIVEIAGGYRLENDVACGPWLRQFLERTRPGRLSVPALETLAVVAYRQPCTRAQVEEIRGVAVDAIMRKLLEMQLLRIVGRSDLPGRPWLFGTTQKFLEHFGLNSLEDLPSREDLKQFDVRRPEGRETAKDESQPELGMDDGSGKPETED
jgi:segregation and condensation protein B